MAKPGRSPTSMSANAATAPPMSPPMWPPIEMPPHVKLKRRLITISPAIGDRHGSIPRARITMTAPPMSPKTAPEAPTVGESGVIRSAPNDPHSNDVMYSARNRNRPMAGSSSVPK